jgi:23S rRNA pseudouridine2457 synthase
LTSRYLLFHKPYRVLSQFTAGKDGSFPRSTLANFISVKNVYPVGRLDFDSEGLLLLTNDGRLQHRLADPRFEHPRTYWVQVEGVPSLAALSALQAGVLIQGYKTKPCTARVITPQVPAREPPVRFRKTIPDSWLELKLTEGRNRQVRHMTAAVGLPTLRLIRVALGTLNLDGLMPGQWRDLTPNELVQLRRQ